MGYVAVFLVLAAVLALLVQHIRSSKEKSKAENEAGGVTHEQPKQQE